MELTSRGAGHGRRGAHAGTHQRVGISGSGDFSNVVRVQVEAGSHWLALGQSAGNRALATVDEQAGRPQCRHQVRARDDLRW
jgi:hypothetical protein